MQVTPKVEAKLSDLSDKEKMVLVAGNIAAYMTIEMQTIETLYHRGLIQAWLVLDKHVFPLTERGKDLVQEIEMMEGQEAVQV